MKNFGLLILGIIIGALAMYFYCCRDVETVVDVEINKPNGLITPKEARALDQAYDLKHQIINDSLFKKSATGDNRSAWWSIEDIQSYINYAENQAGELGYTMDGLRLYLGSYPDDNGETGLTTMFIIPTGSESVAQGSMFTLPQGSNDIPGANGLNKAGNGHPPGANYPQ
jgi:hypothetical protein